MLIDIHALGFFISEDFFDGQKFVTNGARNINMDGRDDSDQDITPHIFPPAIQHSIKLALLNFEMKVETMPQYESILQFILYVYRTSNWFSSRLSSASEQEFDVFNAEVIEDTISLEWVTKKT